MTAGKNAIVLLVEDEPLVRMFADEVLTEDGGFKVIVTSNADEALTILRVRQDIQVLFTDITMPGAMDGLQLAHIVRERWSHIAIIVVSAREPSGQLPQGARFLPKPYPPFTLIQTVHELVAGASPP